MSKKTATATTERKKATEVQSALPTKSDSDETQPRDRKEPMAPLEYERQLMMDTFDDDVVFVHAKGLGVERLFLNHLHLYSDPSFTVFVLNTTQDDEHFFIEKLRQMNPRCPPKLLAADVTSKDRENIYQTGGVQFVTSRIFMVDLLTDRVPLEQTAGILVYRANEVLFTYQESFILRLFREKKAGGFVKAFTDAPTSLTASGLGQLQRLVDRLYVRRVRVLPRFDETVKATFAPTTPSFVEIAVDLTAAQRRIRTCLIDIIATCVRELKQCTHGLELSVEEEAASSVAALRPTALEIDLRKKSLLLTDRQERLMSDLRILRRFLETIENLDAVSQYAFIHELRNSKEFLENNSGWFLTPTAKKVIDGIEAECTAKDAQQKPTINPPPKWRAFASMLDEIKADAAKTPPAADATPPPVLVLTSTESTCAQLIDLVKFGSAKLCWQQTRQFAELTSRAFGAGEPADAPLWPPDAVAVFHEQILAEVGRRTARVVSRLP